MILVQVKKMRSETDKYTVIFFANRLDEFVEVESENNRIRH